MAAHHDHNHPDHIAARALVAFLVLVVAFGVLLLFQSYSETIIMTGNFQSFMVLVMLGFALLVGLLYLTNKPHHHKTSSSKSGKRKKR